MIAFKVISDDKYTNNLGQSLVRGCSSFGRSTEHEFCQYLEWELNVDPDTLMELKDMVQKDFT